MTAITCRHCLTEIVWDFGIPAWRSKVTRLLTCFDTNTVQREHAPQNGSEVPS